MMLLIFFTLGKSTVKAQAPAQCQDVMLQAFYWDSYTDSKWTTLTSKANEIASNYSLVWLPPSGNCQSSSSMGYTPIWWFDQNSAFGTQAELVNLVSTLNSYGAKTIADVVVNHRNGQSTWTDFPTETYNGVTYAMGPAQICSTDEVRNQPGQATPTGAPDTGEDFNGSRDLDHTSSIVQNAVKGYMQFLKTGIGYNGWRYDMTKGYSASYVNQYNTAANAYFSVGEYFDGSYDLCKAWIIAAGYSSTTFDFPLKFQLNAAMWNGGMNLNNLVWLANGTTPQPAGLIHHPDTKRYAVTFVDNHDTYVTGNANKFTGNVLAAYAFLMGSPGVPCVLLAHWNSNKAAIAAMIAARRAVKVHSESSVVVNQYSTNIYVATITGLNGTLIVKIGSDSYTAPSDYTLATSGTDYAIWTKTTTAVPPYIMVTPSGGTYYSSQTISMSTNNGASIYYTTNNTAPTTSSTLYTPPLVLTGTTTLRSIAYNPTSHLYSNEANNIYTIATLPTSIKVKFKAPTGWTGCKVYSWVGSTPLTGAWPGTAMTLGTDGYYSFTITGFTTVPIGIVFNSGVGTSPPQTVDLSASTDMCWDAGPMSGGKYTATVVTCPQTAVEDNPSADWTVNPNPTTGVVRFIAPSGMNTATLTSTLGTQIPIKAVWNSNNCTIDLSANPSGVYYLTLTGPSGKRTTKAIVKY